MKILILGGGGREHALAWKIRNDSRTDQIFCAPGNAGTGLIAPAPQINLNPPFHDLIQWVKSNGIELVIVGPEDPLAQGVVDELASIGVDAFGPTAAGARLEASKKFAKEVMTAAGVPTARSETFTSSADALRALDQFRPPYVIKADGLAAGKGVTVAATRAEAEAAIHAALDERAFGEAGAEILIEEFLEGVEASLLAFTDGKTVLAMESAQDHKPVFNGDRGPNTGGMGTISPAPALTPELRQRAIDEILQPTINELAKRGITYRGVLYAGLMLTADGPKVIEFNCRFGDPETQVLLPRLINRFTDIALACVHGTLDQIELKWSPEACVCVIAASGGYPGPYERKIGITGVEPKRVPRDEKNQVYVFHAGTAQMPSGRVVTWGGRVLGVTAMGRSLDVARGKAYARLKDIEFRGMHYRTDIGFRALGGKS